MEYKQYFSPGIKQYVLAILLLLSIFPALSQERNSMQINTLGNDTVLINRYIEIGMKGTGISPDSSFKLLHTAYGLAKNYGLLSKVGLIWCVMAGIDAQQGNYADCKLYIDSALQLAEQIKDGSLICYAHIIAAYRYQYSSNFAMASAEYFQALETVKEYKTVKSSLLPSLYNNVGALMGLLQEDSLALQYKLLAKYYTLKEKPIDSVYLLYVLANIGQTYLKTDSSISISYFKGIYDQIQKRDGSNIYGQIQKRGDNAFSFRILANLASAYMSQKQYDSSEHYLLLAIPNAVTDPSKAEAESLAGYLAFYKKDYKNALKHFTVAAKLGGEYDYENMEETYEGLAEVYTTLKDYKKANEQLQKYLELHKRKTGDEKKIVVDFMLNLQTMEHERRMLQKQAEIAAEEAAIKKRNVLIGAMCILLSLLVIIFIMAYRNYKNRKVLLNERVKMLEQHKEIDQLKAEAEGADKERARIAYDLHDGVMVRLANVKINLNALPIASLSFSENKNYQDVITQLEMATRELRNTAHNLMPEILLEDGIAQAIFYFCKTTEDTTGLKIRFQQLGDPLPRLQTYVETTVYRIVQGLVQNVVRHAQATTALVQLQYTDHLYAITVEDNGRGIVHLKSAEGYGLKSIRSRMKLLNGAFDIESGEGLGATAYLEFDVRPFLISTEGNVQEI